MKKLAGGVLALGTLVGLTACSPSEKNFKDEAEKFIESDEVTEQAGQEFSAAACDEPSSTEVGTVFSCTATGTDGVDYTFDVEITAENEFSLSLSGTAE